MCDFASVSVYPHGDWCKSVVLRWVSRKYFTVDNILLPLGYLIESREEPYFVHAANVTTQTFPNFLS